MARGYIPTPAPRATPDPLNLVSVMATPPTITMSAANAVTSITGATLRAPGNGTTVDIATDPTYAWLGTPSITYLTGANAGYTTPPNLTGTLTSQKWTPSVVFDFYGDKLEFVFKAFSGNWDHQIRVDGRYVQEAALRSTGLTTGAVYRVLVDFGSVGHRQIRYDFYGSGFAGVAAAPAHTVARVRNVNDTPTVILGDSISATANPGTANGFTRPEAWPYTAAHMLGWNDVRNSAMPSTGFVTAGTDTPFVGRLDDFRVPGARFVVYGGYNDVNATADALNAGIDTVFSVIKEQRPAEFIVFGVHPKNGTVYVSPAFLAVNAILRAKAAQYGATFIDTFTIRPFTGSGNSTTPNGSGNSDLFVNADNVHPTRAGAQYMGRVYAEAIRGAN